MWATTLATQSFGTGGMIFTAIAVGVIAGLINGVLISYGRLVPFIATLAMLVAARGLAANISGKQTQIHRSRHQRASPTTGSGGAVPGHHPGAWSSSSAGSC